MKNILPKLLAVQKEIKPIEKDAMNPHFKNKYFDINSLLAAVKPILNAHGLLLLQPLIGDTLKTIITDVESAESYESTALLPQVSDPQKAGSIISYYRRYSLVSLLGLEGEDDDGNAAAPVTAPNAPQSSVAPKAVQSTDLGKCKACGADNKWSEKKNKPYCAALCWNNKRIDYAVVQQDQTPIIQQDAPDDSVDLSSVPF